MSYGTWLTKMGLKSNANYVEYGFGQVEPNHLSAQRTAQIYAQLPANKEIKMLEQGQFVKYDYLNEEVNFTGAGEWMLVYNEIKLYRDEYQSDAEFAMIKDNYQARIYSPFGGDKYTGAPDTNFDKQSRYYNGVDDQGNDSITIGGKTYKYDDVTKAADPRDPYATEDPFHIESQYTVKKMPEGTSMVPRVFKTNVGDIFTTNTVNVAMAGDEPTPEEIAALTPGKLLTPGATGILEEATDTTGMLWQVVKVYDLADRQRAVKVMRIQ